MQKIPSLTNKAMPHTFIIAEAGVNHNGSLENALRLVDAAAKSGADAIKFQTFEATELATTTAPKASYQKQSTSKSESQLEMLAKLQLRASDYRKLSERCTERGLEFISSPFDVRAVDLLLDLGVRQLKIPSGEITNAPLLLKAAASGLPCILSTGMANLGDIETALAILAYGYRTERVEPEVAEFYTTVHRGDFDILSDKVTLLHCTSLYPTPYEDVNLHCLHTLRSAFGLKVGYSDHTMGVEVSVAAVALGSEVIEKHFTMSRAQEGPDHKASLEPEELRSMVAMIRNVEKALGTNRKFPVDNELDTRAIARKGLVAKRAIHEGEKFHADNVAIKRPESGLSPLMYWKLLGRTASKSYTKDQSLSEE